METGKATDSNAKHAGGRPTLYKPEYVETLPEMFRDGQSVLEVATELGVVRDTLYEWAKVYPEFSDALTRGKAISQAWWERMGRENLFDTDDYDGETKQAVRRRFNQTLWAKNVSCRFRADWTERQEVLVETKEFVVKPAPPPEG